MQNSARLESGTRSARAWKRSNRFHQATAAGLERLEDRMMLSTVTWTASVGGDWNTAGNWSTNTVPTSTDDVIINRSEGITVTVGGSFNGDGATAKSLTVTGDNTLRLQAQFGNTLTLAAASTISHIWSSFGNLSLGGNLTLTGSSELHNTLTIDGPGSLIVNGAISSDGNMTVKTAVQLNSTYTQPSGALSLVGGSASLDINSGGTYVSQGGVIQSDGGLTLVKQGGTFQVDNTNIGFYARLNFPLTVDHGTFKLTHAGYFAAGSTITLDNAHIVMTESSQAFFDSGTNVVLKGTIDVASSGTFWFRQGRDPVANGSVQVDAGGATIQAYTGAFQFQNTNIKGPGALTFAAGGAGFTNGNTIANELNFGGDSTVNGALVLSGASSKLHILNGATFDLADGSASISGDSPNGVVIDSGGTMTVHGGGVGGNDITVPVDNEGTIQTISASLNLAGTIAQVSSVGGVTSLTGGTWLQDAGSLFRFGGDLYGGTRVDRIGPNVKLIVGGNGGIGVFAPIQGLSTNDGYIELINTRNRFGNTIAFGSSFTNTGTLILHSNSSIDVGTFTQTSTGSTKLYIAGTDVSTIGQINAGTSAHFAGSLQISTEGGYGATTGTNYPLIITPSRSGTFSTISGTKEFEVVLNDTGLSVNALAGAGNLLTQSVSDPANLSTGQNVAFSYTVKNGSGNATPVNDWTDAVYLSTDSTLGAGDILLTKIAHTGGLAANASYTNNVNTPLRLGSSIADSYHVIVVSDAQGKVADTDRTNNVLASTGSFTVSVPTATVGSPVSGTIASGQDLVYKISVPAGNPPAFVFTGAVAGEAEIYQSLGQIPSRSSFDGSFFDPAGTVQRVAAQATVGATYYVLLHGRENAGSGQSFTLNVSATGLELLSTSVTTGGNVGRVSTTLTGTLFTPNTTFALVGGSTINAQSVNFINSSSSSATFDLTGAAAGTYSIRATDGSSTKTLTNAFTITAGGQGGRLAYGITGPSAVRAPYVNAQVTITYSNIGTNDIDAPIFAVTAESAKIKLAGESAFLPGLFALSNGKLLSVYEVLGVSGGLAGTLSPGETGSITLQFEPTDRTAHAPLSIGVNLANAGAMQMNYSGIDDQFRPAGLADDSWNATFNNFVNNVGPTLRTFAGRMARDADYLGQFGPVSPSVARLINFELQRADDFGNISARYVNGIFGRGIADPFNLRASLGADGSISIFDGVKARQYFQVGSEYVSVLGDGSVVSRSGNIITLREASGQTTVFRSDGQVDYQQQSNGARETAGYNASGQLTSITDNTNGDVTTLAYGANGKVSSSTDAVGRVTTFTYDSSGEHLASRTDAIGTTSYTYDVNHALLTTTTPDGVTVTNTYDSQGRLTASTRSGGSGSETLSYTYGDAGKVTVTAPDNTSVTTYRTYGGSAARTVDASGNVSGYLYNAEGRLIGAVGAGGETLKINANSSSITVTNPDKGTIVAPLGGANRRGQSITDPLGNTTSFQHDSAGNLIHETYADNTTESATYDGAGRVATSTDANGVTATFTYDAKGLLTQKSYSNGASISYTYDAHRNLLTATDANGTTTYTYSPADQLLSVSYPNGTSISYTYDSAGRQSTVTDQAGFVSRYSYNSLGRLSEVRDTANALVVSYAYNSVGLLQTETRGNGATTSYTYDANGRIASITHRNASNAIVQSYTYTRDARGLVTAVTDQAAQVTHYTYDANGQLTVVALPSGRTITYTYDANGNRKTVVDTANGTSTYAVNSTSAYTSGNGETFTYDPSGRMLTRTKSGVTTTYTYNYLGLLASETTGGNTTTYQYDAQGTRIGQTVNGVQTKFAIDRIGGNIFGEYTGSTTTNYVTGFGLTARVSGGTANYYHYDSTGNTTYLSGSAGASVQSYSYLPFGEILSQSGSVTQSYTFNGRFGVRGDGSGLFDMRGRSYDANTGRFISRDPLQLDGGDTNFYRFAQNNPVERTDPTGTVVYTNPFFNPDSVEIYDWFRKTVLNEKVDEILSSASKGATKVAEKKFEQQVERKVTQEVAKRGAQQLGKHALAETLPVIGEAIFVAEVSFDMGGILASDILDKGQGYAKMHQLDFYRVQDEVFEDKAKNFKPNNGAGEWYRDLYQQALDRGLSPADAHVDAVKALRKFGIEDPLFNPNPLYTNKKLTGEENLTLFNVIPGDPNNVIGPRGAQAEQMPDVIAPGQTRFEGFIGNTGPYNYEIEFQNKPTATAPAQVVRVTSTLDANLDLSTFHFTSFSFGKNLILVPDNVFGTSYSTIYDATSTLGVLVKIDATVNTSTRVLDVTYTSLDPNTNDIPVDPFAGFLPTDDATGRGSGFLTYTVSPDAGLTDNTQISAIATIVFDFEAPLDTPTIHNTIDISAPTSSVNALSATTLSTLIPVNWSGSDSASGVSSFDILVSIDGGVFSTWLTGTSSTSAFYSASPGHTYAFESIATDGAGNTQGSPSAAVSTNVPAIDHTLTIDSKHKGTYIDAGGNTVTVTLAGPGTGTLSFLAASNADPISSVFDGTSTKSIITYAVKKGVTSIQDVTINGSLKGFNAAKGNLLGGFHVTGTLNNLKFAGTLAATSLAIDGPAVGSTISFVSAVDLNIVAPGGIKSLQAKSWTGSVGGFSSLSTSFVKSLIVKGAMSAGLTATGVLTSARIGGVVSGGWNVSGGAKAITFNSTSGWTGTFGGVVNSIITKGDLTGSLSAVSLRTIKAGGNLSASVTLTDAASNITASAGKILSGTWTIAGGAKSILAKSISGSYAAEFGGAVASILVKSSDAGSISALRFGAITVGGDMTGASILATGGSSLGKTAGIRSLIARGSVTSSSIRSGWKIGSVIVGGMNHSVLFAGISNLVSSLPTTDDIVTAAAIGSFTTTGKSPFAGSNIAADTINSVILKKITDDNAGVPFGVAAHTLKSIRVNQTGKKPFAWTNKKSTALLSGLTPDLTVSII